jgi:hypothetical protein
MTLSKSEFIFCVLLNSSYVELAWKNAPKGRILKSDTKIAKNYLSENEIKDLERAISAYFDHIEMVIKNRTEMTMQT